MSTKRIAAIITIAAGCALLVALCSGCGSLNSLRGRISASATATAREAAGATATAPTAQASGGTLRVSGGLPPTLDPAMVQDSTSAEYVVHLFSGLVVLDRNLEVTPDIAERWDISDDGTVYTFHLNPAAAFQDGTAVTADDFVYSLERALSPETGSPVAASYLNDIVGAESYARGASDSLAEACGPSMPRPWRFASTPPRPTFSPNSPIPRPWWWIVAKSRPRATAGYVQPNGSGPYVLESISQDEIVLVRNERYYGPRPAVGRVEFVLSGGVPLTMYENGLLDLVEVGPSDIERVQDPEQSALYPAARLAGTERQLPGL